MQPILAPDTPPLPACLFLGFAFHLFFFFSIRNLKSKIRNVGNPKF
jgi:hypothetical protein